jgi:hypothetical protein
MGQRVTVDLGGEWQCYVATELGGVSEITEELFLSRLKERT